MNAFSQTLRRPMARKARRTLYANDFSALNPTVWANEALVQLLPNMVMANLVTRDFDNKVAKFGDMVNVFVPGTFQMNRKGAPCEDVVVQDATGSSIQAALDQWPQVSFLICDGEEDRNTLDLLDTLLVPAIQALGTGIDRILASQYYRFIANTAGHANNVDATNVESYILEAREKLNRANVPVGGRVLILTPGTETKALQVQAYSDASQSGDAGTALREASLGRKHGFDIYMTQTQPEVSTGQTTDGVLTASAAGAGATTLTLAGAGLGNVKVGEWLLVAGDDTPQHITAWASPAATIYPGLKRATAGSAAVTIVASGVTTAAYTGTTTNPRVVGYAKEILVDGFDNSPPQVGQMVSFANQTETYVIITVRVINAGAGEFGLVLDRPLALNVANGATVHLGPAAKYNMALLRSALAFINRPLPQPRAGTGAASKVVTDPVNKISLRVTITYDGLKQGHLVTVDTLMGVAVYNDDMGVLMLG